jgi:hypothetical protein
MLEDIVSDYDNAFKLLEDRREDILERYRTLKDLYEELSSLFRGKVYINKDLLLHAIESYFLDIQRLKEYHGIKYITDEKISAFLIKWILKIKPIQVKQGVEADRYCFLANEIYGLAAGLLMINVELTLMEKNLKYELIYSLHNRDFEPKLFSTTLRLIKDLYKK